MSVGNYKAELSVILSQVSCQSHIRALLNITDHRTPPATLLTLPVSLIVLGSGCICVTGIQLLSDFK